MAGDANRASMDLLAQKEDRLILDDLFGHVIAFLEQITQRVSQVKGSTKSLQKLLVIFLLAQTSRSFHMPNLTRLVFRESSQTTVENNKKVSEMCPQVKDSRFSLYERFRLYCD